MADATELSFQIRYRSIDLYKAIFIAAIRRPRSWLSAIAFAAGMIIVTGPCNREMYQLWPLFFLGGVVFTAIVMLLRARSVTKYPNILSPISFTFSDSGITTKYVNSRMEADWSLATGAFETAAFIFVGMQRGSFHPIPKAQLTNAQITRLREILRSHVSKKAKLWL